MSDNVDPQSAGPGHEFAEEEEDMVNEQEEGMYFWVMVGPGHPMFLDFT